MIKSKYFLLFKRSSDKAIVLDVKEVKEEKKEIQIVEFKITDEYLISEERKIKNMKSPRISQSKSPLKKQSSLNFENSPLNSKKSILILSPKSMHKPSIFSNDGRSPPKYK
jgi:hypothetical protein